MLTVPKFFSATAAAQGTLGGIILDMQTKNQVQKHFNILLLLLSFSLGLYAIIIFKWFLVYELFVYIFLLLTLISSTGFLVLTIIDVIKLRQFPTIVSILIFLSLIITYSVIYSERNGMFWGKKIINAAFLDDRSRMDLTLYENGKFIIFSNWLFGEERFEGSYKISGDTIIFSKIPVTNNDFVSKEIIINHAENKIYFRKGKDGNYDKSFYFFQIDFKK